MLVITLAATSTALTTILEIQFLPYLLILPGKIEYPAGGYADVNSGFGLKPERKSSGPAVYGGAFY